MNRILIVEDEPSVQRVARAALNGSGREVLVAGTADEARSAIAKTPPGEDLCLVVDVVLANESGIALAQEVLASGRARRALLMSGFTDDVLLGEPALSERVSFLRKPFTSEELVAAVDALYS